MCLCFIVPCYIDSECAHITCFNQQATVANLILRRDLKKLLHNLFPLLDPCHCYKDISKLTLEGCERHVEMSLVFPVKASYSIWSLAKPSVLGQTHELAQLRSTEPDPDCRTSQMTHRF